MKRIIFMLVFFLSARCIAQTDKNFDGLNMNLGNLFMLSDAKTRSISPENYTGEPGKDGMATLENGTSRSAARDLGQGWKVNPSVTIEPGQTFSYFGTRPSLMRLSQIYLQRMNWK